MAGLLKKLFRGKHTKEPSVVDEETERRESKRGRRRISRFDTSAAAPYHTETQPRAHRPTHSYAGHELSDGEGIRYEPFNRSLEMKRTREERMSRRRPPLKLWRRNKLNTSEYGSGNPSPLFDQTLDDSESDYYISEKDEQIYELEKKLQESREKIKECRERLRAERDARTRAENDTLTLKEVYKRKKKKVEKERQDLMNLVSSLQSKVNFYEQNQRYAGIGLLNPPLLETVVGAGEALCNVSASIPVSSCFNRSSLHNNTDEIDETKNFRRSDTYDVELARTSESSSSVSTEEAREITMLQSDDITLVLPMPSSSRRVHSDSDLCRFSHFFEPLSLQL